MRGWRPGVHNHQTFRCLFERGLCEEGIPTVITDAAQPGNTTLGGMQRFERDILNPRPDAVLISFGLNDASPQADGCTPRVSLETYRECYETWFAALKRMGVLVVLMTPYPFAPGQLPIRNEVLGGYMEVIRDLAAKHQVPLADIFGELQGLAAGGRDLSGLYLDHVHLNPEGNRVVADLLLDFERKSGVFRTLSDAKN